VLASILLCCTAGLKSFYDWCIVQRYLLILEKIDG